MNADIKTMATPVDGDRLARYYREVESFQASKARGARRWGRVAWTIAGVSLVANLALAVTTASMLPGQVKTAQEAPAAPSSSSRRSAAPL
ncbi:MAG: hypothetical protein B7X01_00510, partial [Acidiphilium sp. 21-62-4]